MLQILIVDDEIHTIEGIQAGVNWHNLGITAVYTAYSVNQAKAILNSEKIDLLLSDIEMPHASGLELAEWVSEHCPQIETIFLTCHAEFNYAKQAIQLGSFGYMLKPVPFDELEQILSRAIDKINSNAAIAEDKNFSQLWHKNQPMIIERFWQDILSQVIPTNEAATTQAIVDRNIPYSVGMIFTPILISVQRWHKSMNLRNEKLLEYAIKKTMEEILEESGFAGQTVPLSKGRMLFILSIARAADNESLLGEIGEKMISFCKKYYYCDLSIYIGQEVLAHEMLEMLQQLTAMEQNNVAYNNKVFSLSSSDAQLAYIQPPDINMSVWVIMLQEMKGDQIIEEAGSYLDSLRRYGVMDAKRLQRFFQNFQQIIYYVLQSKGIEAHALFSDNVTLQLSTDATRSVTDLMEWIKHTVQKAIKCMSMAEQSVVEKVIHFIKTHLSEDLSRVTIANHVFLNPDYLTRIFKKELGIGISDYLFQERIKIARELLTNTDLSISVIASHVGYTNFSHFSRMFKKETELSPYDYRRLYRKLETE